MLSLILSCKRDKKEIVSPTVGPITEAVFASGHIEAVNQITLTALNDGYIENVLVNEGDILYKNQTLFKQDKSISEIQQADAYENVKIAKDKVSNNSAVIKQLEAQLKTAKDKLSQDKNLYERMQRLYSLSSVSKLELENAKLNYTNSFNNVDEIQQKILSIKTDLYQSLAISENQYDISVASSNYYDIKSPDTFKVYSLLKKKGELVRKGEAVAILGKANQFKVVLNIDEASISKIKLSQKVLIEINTEKGKTYLGHISKVYPLFDEINQSYKVEAEIDNYNQNLINGSLIQANIIVASKNKALLIPKECLLPENKVLVNNDSKPDTIKVKTGIVSNEWVEIIEGIYQNQQIFINK